MGDNLKLNCIVFVLFLIHKLHASEGSDASYVTCGSITKLLNTDYNYRLHSHDVQYGSGSGQQSVTGTESKEDVGSHWKIKAKTDENCKRGEPIKCGDIIRLEHLTTKKNLHSHFFSSPLSSKQEVSCYGINGTGDTGDNWEVVCNGDSVWKRGSTIRLQHVDTRAFLGMSGRSFGRPISGQMEVVGQTYATTGTEWGTAEGLFIVHKEKEKEHFHSEL